MYVKWIWSFFYSFTIIITINKFSRISDWFASNISLLVLAVVVPLCSSTYNFSFFVSYNAVWTMCNLLFVIILIKHKFVTRYVCYISVCILVAVLLWSTFQIFCFFLYSRFACSTTWVVPTNFSKLESFRSEFTANL